MKKKIYVLSGLGADERVFQRMDFSDYDVTFVRWIDPITNESIEDYTSRIVKQITTPNPIVIGLSFGGIIAVEAAKQIHVSKTILINSVKNKCEIPFYFRIAGMIGGQRIVPTFLLKKANLISFFAFGIQSDFEKQLLKKILDDTNPIFLRWAIDKIIKWENITTIENLIQIHGSCDRIFPLCFVKSGYRVAGGGHLMTLTHPLEIMKILHHEIYI